MRANVPSTLNIVGEEEIDDGLVTPGSFIAVAAGERTDTFWFMKVTTINQSSPKEKVDDYGVKIALGIFFSSGYFLEKDTTRFFI